MTVHVYTPGDKVDVLLNGRIVATKTVVETDQRVATFNVPYAPESWSPSHTGADSGSVARPLPLQPRRPPFA